MEQPQKICVLVADDHDLVRQGVIQLLQEVSPQSVVHEARDWADTLTKASAGSDLSLAIVDLNMPGMPAMDGLRQLLQQAQTLPVAVLAGSDDAEVISQVIHAGASGYIPKSASVEVMRSALRLLLAGEMYLPSALLSAGGRYVLPEQTVQYPPATLPELTPRQRQVTELLACGLTNKAIAQELGMADATVKAHLNAIYRLLGVNSRLEAIRCLEGR